MSGSRRLGLEQPLEPAFPQVREGVCRVPQVRIDRQRGAAAHVHERFIALRDGYCGDPRIRHQDDLTHDPIS
jgi:hypothetical protein